jgi:hypothetical protein
MVQFPVPAQSVPTTTTTRTKCIDDDENEC